jgi:hypothetical protein
MAWQTGFQARIGNTTLRTANGQAVVPVGGGTVNFSIAASAFGFTRFIEGGTDIAISTMSPVVQNISQPVFGLIGTSLALGVTLGAGTGTTLGWQAQAWGI